MTLRHIAVSAIRIAVLVPLVLAVVLVTAFYSYRMMTGEYFYTNKFGEVEVGAHISTAIEIMGPATEISARFRLAQPSGYVDAHERARLSGAHRYYIWDCCGDRTYTIGVDASDTIIIKEMGGT